MAECACVRVAAGRVEGERLFWCVRLQLEVPLPLFTLLFHVNFPFVAFFFNHAGFFSFYFT